MNIRELKQKLDGYDDSLIVCVNNRDDLWYHEAEAVLHEAGGKVVIA